MGGREITLKDITESPPTANSENQFCRYSLVFCPRLAGETLSYSVKFGLLPATSLPQANLHKLSGAQLSACKIRFLQRNSLTGLIMSSSVESSWGFTPKQGEKGERANLVL